jgi:hypothetical protein
MHHLGQALLPWALRNSKGTAEMAQARAVERLLDLGIARNTLS